MLRVNVGGFFYLEEIFLQGKVVSIQGKGFFI